MAYLTNFSNTFFDFSSFIFYPFLEEVKLENVSPEKLDKSYAMLGKTYKILTNVVTSCLK